MFLVFNASVDRSRNETACEAAGRAELSDATDDAGCSRHVLNISCVEF